MQKSINRRSSLKGAGGTALGAASLVWTPNLSAASAEQHVSFQSAWAQNADRPWPGPEYWSNPLQDWRVRGGQLECISAGGNRKVVLLTREVADRNGDLVMSVRCGALDDALNQEGFVGFCVGMKNQMEDYRATAIYGRGMNAGVMADGSLFIGTPDISAPRIDLSGELHPQMHATPSAGGYSVRLRVTSVHQRHSAEISREAPKDCLTGMLAQHATPARWTLRPCRLSQLRTSIFTHPISNVAETCASGLLIGPAGSKVDEHEDRTFGPILFTQYTVTRGILKLSAQFPPLGNAPDSAILQMRETDGTWKSIATATIDPAWNAVFCVTSWDATRDRPYRVLYEMSGDAEESKLYTYTGIVRKDPVGKQDIVIGLLTSMLDFGFPHADFTRNFAYHKPDILLWTGDHVYEPVGGFERIEGRDPNLVEPAMLDFLRKWLIFEWVVRDLTRDTHRYS